VWANGFGGFASVDGDAFARGYDFTSGGLALGADYRLTDRVTVGVFGSYAHTWTDLGPGASLEVDAGRVGLYGAYHDRWCYADAGIFGGYDGVDTRRPSFLGHAQGTTDAEAYSAFLNLGHDVRFGRLAVGPVVAIQYTSYHLQGFTEGGSILPVRVHGDSEDSLRTDLGVRASYAFHLGKVEIRPQVRAVWEHEYKYSALPLTAGYEGLAVAPGTFYGPRLGQDSALVSAGVEIPLTRAAAVYVNYDGQLGRAAYDAHAVTGGCRVAF
jgi:outer membrane autotransporter protein